MSIAKAPRAVTIVGLALFGALGLAALRPRGYVAVPFGGAGAGQSTGQADAALMGVIDIHAHQDPDSFGPSSPQQPRSIDAIDLAKLAKARGMRGLVLKHHYDQTAGLAYLVRQGSAWAGGVRRHRFEPSDGRDQPGGGTAYGGGEGRMGARGLDAHV